MNIKAGASPSYLLARFLLTLLWPFIALGREVRHRLEDVQNREERYEELFEKWMEYDPSPTVYMLFPAVYQEDQPPEGNLFWAEYQELSFEDRQELWRWLHKKSKRLKPLNHPVRMAMKKLILKMEFYATHSHPVRRFE